MSASGRRLRRLLRAAHRRWPRSFLWSTLLAVSYTQRTWAAPAGSEERRRYAAEAIRWYEREEDSWRDVTEWRLGPTVLEYQRLANRGTMAWLAFEIGDVSRAERWAEDAVRLPDVVAQVPWMTRGFPPDVWAVHRGNIVLGKIALDRGDSEEAERRLSLASGAWSRSDRAIEWGDPDFSLAQELLHRGRTEPVVSYLTACGEIWVYGEQHIDGWIRAIESGAVPDLRPWRHARPESRLTLRGFRSTLRALKRRRTSMTT